MIPQVSPYTYIFPDPRLASPEGLVAFGGDLSPNRLIAAYKQGIFPWFNEDDPILWWSPDPRLVLYPDAFKISRSLRKSMKRYEVRFDTRFEEVMRLCGKMRKESWINESMIEAYCKLYELGYAHSIETYYKGEFIGGLYGVALGAAFFGESMVSLRADASKVALAKLCEVAQKWGFDFIDCQIPSEHLKRLGAVEICRDTFLNQLQRALQKRGKYGKWRIDDERD